jgi:hypothetical protein
MRFIYLLAFALTLLYRVHATEHEFRSFYIHTSCEERPQWPDNYKESRRILKLVIDAMNDPPDDIILLVKRLFYVDYANAEHKVRWDIILGICNAACHDRLLTLMLFRSSYRNVPLLGGGSEASRHGGGRNTQDFRNSRVLRQHTVSVLQLCELTRS